MHCSICFAFSVNHSQNSCTEGQYLFYMRHMNSDMLKMTTDKNTNVMIFSHMTGFVFIKPVILFKIC
jgi:hypothetical protein